ncbi:MAG TPA: DUF4349 domain-containing protein [Candidatus Eremiobacteraceae bacterium]|nr:DUF4349 domain-containing protein [Candidatus Eremiobacteraceae bacterium]
MNHQDVAELLPWYVNGTLAPHERAQVEAELASCPLCAGELAELQRIHAAMHEIDQDAPGPSESLMARTSARIDAQPARVGAAFSVKDWWNSLTAAGKITVLVPAALAAVLVVIAVRQSALHQVALSTYTTPAGVAGKTLDERTQSTDQVAQAPAPPQAGAPLPITSGAVARSASVNEAAAPATSQLQATNVLKRVPLPSGERPQLIRTGTIDLLVPDVEQTLAQLQSLAQLQFGDVISLDDSTPSTPGVRHTAQVQLAVPADRFDQTMQALVKLGAVQSRNISAENVSDQIVDAQARLRNLRRTETDMLRILDRAGKIPDVLDVTQQIAQVREQIEQLDAQVQSLQHRVAYSTISIAIEDEKPVTSAQPGMGAQLDDAWKAAVRELRNYTVRVAAVMLTIIAFAPYWLGVLLIALFIANRLRRPSGA